MITYRIALRDLDISINIIWKLKWVKHNLISFNRKLPTHYY